MTLGAGFEGIGHGDTSPVEPPDTHVAAGLNHVVEVVNTAIRFYEKTGTILSTQELAAFFSPVGPVGPLPRPPAKFAFDPVVAYDEIEDRFVVAALAADFDTDESYLLYAVSDAADPTDGFTEMHKIDVKEFSAALGQFVWGDYPKVGWNADAHVFTLNMFGFISGYSHVSVITIDKTTALDADPGTLDFTDVNRDGTHFTMAAATMHGSVTGDPMYFVEEESYAGGDKIRVVKMTDVLSAAPTFTDTVIDVANYVFPDPAAQPGGTFNVNDNRILNAEWRGDRLVAAHTASGTIDGFNHATWYEFDTSGAVPTLAQQQQYGGAVDTYFPSVAINAAGDIGMTYMQSSVSQFVSMYVTGQKFGDTPGTMHAGVLAAAGTDKYTGSRGGDYIGITVDPTDDPFWAANEYSGNQFWNTYVQNFELTDGGGAGGAYVAADVKKLRQVRRLRAGSRGVVTLLDGADDAFAAIDLGGRSFTFYGTSYTGAGKLFVSTNGLITFGSGNAAFTNTDLTAGPSQPTIAVLWDDWTTAAAAKGRNDAVLFLFDDANNRLVIQWNEVRRFGDSTRQRATFQAILELNTGATNGDIRLQFLDLKLKGSAGNNGGSATVGVKDAGPQGPNRELVSFNDAANPFIDDGRNEAVLIHDTAVAPISVRVGAALHEDVLDILAKNRVARLKR